LKIHNIIFPNSKPPNALYSGHWTAKKNIRSAKLRIYIKTRKGVALSYANEKKAG